MKETEKKAVEERGGHLAPVPGRIMNGIIFSNGGLAESGKT